MDKELGELLEVCMGAYMACIFLMVADSKWPHDPESYR